MALTTVFTTVLAGMPVPLTGMPTCRPVVLAQVTVGLPLVVAPLVRLRLVAPTRPAVLEQVTVALPLVIEQPLKVMPPAYKVSAEPLPVALVLRTKVVELVMELMVAPVGTLVPATIMPGHNPVVLAQVTAVLALVVVLPERLTGVERLLPLLAWLIWPLPPETVVQAFSAPLPCQGWLYGSVVMVSLKTWLEVCAPWLYESCTWEMVTPEGGVIAVVT